MAFTSRDFDTMVEETLDRIVDANIGISNRGSSSVIRTIVESIMSENSILYSQNQELYKAYSINDATGDDLDNLIAILGVIRKDATPCTAMITFSRPEASLADISIPYGTIVTTQQNTDGNIYEFMVIVDDAVLPAGSTSVEVLTECTTAGHIYLPQNTINIMNSAPIGIDKATNIAPITGGTNRETDAELRQRAKNALSELGKGTISAIKTAVKNISGVSDVLIADMPNNIIGTINVVIASDTIPVTPEKMAEVENTIYSTKAAGIKPNIIYPEIVNVDVSVNIVTTDVSEFDPSTYDMQLVSDAIAQYANGRTIGETFVVNQMERAVLNVINNEFADIITIAPTSNVSVTGIEIIKCGTITVTANPIEWR